MTYIWKNDQDLFALMKEHLFSAVVGDILDQMGYLHQFIPPQVQPLHPTMVVVGRAMPVFLQDISANSEPRKFRKPFGLMLEALDALKANEVYIATGGSPSYALWGELMSTRAMKLGAAGAVLDGYTRDADGILSLNFPTFSHGCYAQDQAPRGEVVDFRIPVTIGEVEINPGDIIFGDRDGVCIIP